MSAAPAGRRQALVAARSCRSRAKAAARGSRRLLDHADRLIADIIVCLLKIRAKFRQLELCTKNGVLASGGFQARERGSTPMAQNPAEPGVRASGA